MTTYASAVALQIHDQPSADSWGFSRDRLRRGRQDGRSGTLGPAFFGIKPSLIIKGGFIAGALMGDGNASIPTPEPNFYRGMFGSYGQATNATSVPLRLKSWSEQRSLARPQPSLCCCQWLSGLAKQDLPLNSYLPKWKSILKLTRCVPWAASSLRASKSVTAGSALFSILTTWEIT